MFNQIAATQNVAGAFINSLTNNTSCENNCKSFLEVTNNSQKCINCKSGFVLNNNTCDKFCGKGFYNSENVCFKCSSEKCSELNQDFLEFKQLGNNSF